MLLVAPGAIRSKNRVRLSGLMFVVCTALVPVPAIGEAQLPLDSVPGPREAPAGEGRNLTLPRGKAEIIRYVSGPGTVIIGDEAVAGASLASLDTLVLTGLQPGETNVIVLDEDGTEIDRISLMIVEDGKNVTVWRGQTPETLWCDPTCSPIDEPVPQPASVPATPPRATTVGGGSSESTSPMADG